MTPGTSQAWRAPLRAGLDWLAEELHEIFEQSVQSAEQHRSIIARFGRFPHRNEVMGRHSTAEEEAWLDSGADRMGQ